MRWGASGSCSARASRSSPWCISARCPARRSMTPSAASTAWSRRARKDLDALQAAGFDAVMFGNENDRPYEFAVDTASTATMAYVIGRLRGRDHRAVRRQRAVGPDERRSRWRRRPARASCARSSPAPMPPTWGRGRPTPARRCATATGSAAATWRCSTMSRPSSPIRSTSAQPRRPGAQRGVLHHPRCDPGLRRDHRRGGGDERPRGGEEGAARHAGARQYRRQARDRRRRAAGRRRLHRRLVAEGRRQHLERGRSRARAPSSCGLSAGRAANERGTRASRRALEDRLAPARPS